MLRLSHLATSNFPGLPDIELELHPLTALIGQSGSGKSRLLAAIHWLLTGRPRSTAAPRTTGRDVEVRGVLVGADGAELLIRRSAGSRPAPPLPRSRLLLARRRLVGAAQQRQVRTSDATAAEAMVDSIKHAVDTGAAGEILLIEEPELELNPHAQRHLYHLLRACSERNQVVYSTRSPSLLDAIHHHEIVRLDVSESSLVPRRAPAQPLSDEQRLRLAAEFDRERTEMFFASAVVLVEGQTERLSLPVIFSRLGHDPDALAISITEVGGKGNLPLVARVLAHLNIPHVIAFDADDRVPDDAFAARLAEASPSARQFQLVPDFEAVARLPRQDDKVFSAWRRFSSMPPKRVPPVLRQIVDEAVRLAGQPSGDLAADGQSGHAGE